MPVDDDLEAEIQKQIELLESLQKEVEAAVGRAKIKKDAAKAGQTREQVFPPKQGVGQ